MRNLFKNLHLRTKLLLIICFLFILSLIATFLLNLRMEKKVISIIEENINELSTAIKISVEQLTTEGDTDEERLKNYINKLKIKGIKEISILSEEKEVIASTNPKNKGIKHKDLMITARLGEVFGTKDQKSYNLIIPVIVGDERIGYIHIIMYLEDFTKLLKSNFKRRLTLTVILFTIGIIVSLYLSWRYTKPIYEVADAAREVASGNLSKRFYIDRKDEIGKLKESFNEMVEKLKANKELEERLRVAEELSKLGQISSAIAHEVRNPLNFINLGIDHFRIKFIPEGSNEKKEFLKITSRIKEEIHRLNSMITNFLEYGKPIKLNISRCNINNIIEDVIDLVMDKLNEGKIILEKELNNNIYDIIIDKERLRASFMNIILNSIQAMPDGGKLSIKSYTCDLKVMITFIDTGIGIDPNDINNIFKPFFSRKKAGIGLGLPITKRYIEEHNGKIYIESKKEQGTTVTIELPYTIHEE